MRKSPLLLLATLIPLSIGAQAAPSDDACAALMEARGHLVTMIGSSDKSAYDGLKAKIHGASAKLDATLAAMGGADAAKAAAFKPVWEDFKKTRETEIIPFVYAGKQADAKALAGGVQAERMGKMKAAMGCK
jgi:hypothetical protein